MLMGRWITDSAIGAMTDVVLIFPGSNTLNYQMKDSDGDDVAKMDPVSLFVFDEEGTIAANSRKVELPMAVNRCSFRMMMDDDGPCPRHRNRIAAAGDEKLGARWCRGRDGAGRLSGPLKQRRCQAVVVGGMVLAASLARAVVKLFP